MRLTLALLTSALLATTASAQSLVPELQAKAPSIPYSPAVGISPALAAPAPIATASVDRAEIAPETVAPQTAPVQALTSVPTAKPTPRVDDTDRLQPVRRAKVASERTEVRRVERDEPVQRSRPVATGGRDLGRFWPPVF